MAPVRHPVGSSEDHLALLLKSGPEHGRGSCTPQRFDLYAGPEQLQGRLLHLHEAEHVVLTAETAWGVALQVAAGRPGWEETFRMLLDSCRVVHESFATYLSTTALAVRFGFAAETALTAYPAYQPLFRRVSEHVSTTAGEHRRSLAATALAHVCMQTPVVSDLLDRWPAAPSEPPRALDRPDDRWEFLLRGAAMAELTAAADDALRSAGAADAMASDEPGADRTAALDDRFDGAWAVWEDTVFTGLRSTPRSPPLSPTSASSRSSWVNCLPPAAAWNGP